MQSTKQVKPRLLFVIFSLGNGGTQRMMVNLLNSLEPKANKFVLYLYNNNTSHTLEYEIKKDIKKYIYSGKNFLKFFVRYYVLLSIVRKENINKIICLSKQGAFLALLGKIVFPRRYKIYFRMVSIDSALVESKGRLRKKIKSFLFYDFLCQHVDLIIAQTNYMAKKLQSKRESLTKKIYIINNILLIDRIDQYAKEEIDITYKYIVYVGQLSIEKNIFGIINAYAQIKNEIECKLLLLGDGYMKDQIQNHISNLNLQKSVLLLGHQSNPYKYISRAELLVLFSNYEGLPNVVLESMICKTPVISSKFGGVDEIIEDNFTGLIVEKENITALAKSIKLLLDNRNLRQKITLNSRNLIEKMNEQALNKYQTILNREY